MLFALHFLNCLRVDGVLSLNYGDNARCQDLVRAFACAHLYLDALGAAWCTSQLRTCSHPRALLWVSVCLESDVCVSFRQNLSLFREPTPPAGEVEVHAVCSFQRTTPLTCKGPKEASFHHTASCSETKTAALKKGIRCTWL